MTRLLIIGTGGHGRSVAEAALLCQDYVLTAFLDDAAEPGLRLWDWPVLGPTSLLNACRGQVDAVIVAIGNNVLREALHEQIEALDGLALATVIHPLAIVSPRASVGRGSTIMAGAIVGTGARLGEGVIVNCGAAVDHDCVVEPFGHLGVNAAMAGGSVLGRRAQMSAGASLAQGMARRSG
ncbi:acetyltransferase [Variovorax paradoxus]|uniref:acetyltransferase n=1 Tax=Variovorax paradoxus TaxID=34073 RepID=UPI0006E6B97F|nr:acetyltransferase [Variovorax paradoxus]KPV00609.1 acetyltransferase [Variovorax paradoxus]KPV01437.1 acetyltransferase [Variovorax paradoxus]KPV16923.1 acetyltransferase [Variovorax paradoxus]KPV26822.1 acetyltransferase [Variovorax paradoxus]